MRLDCIRNLFLSVLLAVGCCTLTGRGQDGRQTNDFSVVAGPVLQCPTESKMRVTWITDRNATGTVEYGPTEGELNIGFASHHGLVDANQPLHSVVLENLRPGASYRYRVISREIVKFKPYKIDFGDTLTNEFHQFRTLDTRKADFSFLVLNDIHDQAATIPDLLKVAGPRPYEFVILNGDTISYSDDEKPVVSMLKQAGDSFASSIPMYWVRGNHETRGSFARQLPAYMGLPDERYYYSFDHGPVHFIVLDAGEDKLDTYPAYGGLVDFSRYRRQEAEWLKGHVRDESFRRAKYRIVLCHMPFPSRQAADPARYAENGVFLGMAEAYDQFGLTLESAGVDLMISGHMHAAAVVPPELPRHSYPIVQGGGNKGMGRTLIRVNVTSNELNAEILRPDGSQVNTCRVQPKQSR
jgi:acid phosphatase type 7